MRAIRYQNWKLIEFFENGFLELYNLSDDPNETNNLAAQHAKLAQRLLRKLSKWRDSVGAQMPTPNLNHDPAREGERAKRKEKKSRAR